MDLASCTLLIVDDCAEDRELYRRYLLQDLDQTYTILEAELGQQGLDLWQQQQPDAILLDYSLPDLDGLDFLSRLAASTPLPCLPVVVITGQGNEAIAVRAIKAGAQDYLVKGQITPERLHRAVQGAIATVQMHTELQRLEAERNQAQSAFESSEEWLRLALETTYVGSWDWHLETGAVTWNANHYRLWGYQPGEVEPSYQLWRDRVHPDDIAQVEQAIAYALENQTDYEAEYRVMLPDGSRRWVLGQGRGLYNQSGKPLRLVGIVQDVTEGKQANQKIREQAALLDIASDAIAVCDLENRILYWNHGAERLYGWMASEAIGQNANQLLFKSPPPALAEREVISSGEWQGEVSQVSKTGKDLMVFSRWTLVRNEADEPNSILVVNTDITEKKQLAAQLLRAQRLESIGTLAGGLAHDLNNMLTPILISSQLLQRQLLEERQQELLKMMEANARRGADLVRQVLTFARGTEGKFIPLQPKHLLKEISQISDHTFPKAITITLDLPSNLALISADPTQLHQVLMNLCVNARDAMPEGGSLRLRAENFDVDEIYARMNLEAQPGPYVVISVTDTGTGMTPEVQERIFDPFFTTKAVGQGTGLGLSVVQGIIHSHGGFINVKSKPGEGTQFQVYLRATLAIEAQTTSESELPLGHGELILVVDDEAPLRLIAKTVLEDNNYRVLTASNGIEAINLYLQHRDDVRVILMDMMMPGMGGQMAIQTLKQINSNVRVIASSGLPLNQSIIPGNSTAIQDNLPKPYTALDLLTKIHEVLSATHTDSVASTERQDH